MGAVTNNPSSNQSETQAVSAAIFWNEINALKEQVGTGAQVTPSDIPTTLPPSGPAGGDLGSTYPNPTVAAIHETSGPTKLTVVGISSGEFVKRVGLALTSAPALQPGNNLGDVFSPSTARTNLGLGTASTHPVGDFLVAANNLSDVTPATARTNLGLGTAAVANKVAAGSTGVLDATDATTTNSRAPSGAAAGDLAGTYPNPTLAPIVTAAGPVGDGTHVAQITIDAKGRVTAIASVAITSGGAGTVTSFSSGNLSPLFTTSVATSTTTPALSFSLSTQTANLIFAGPSSGGAAAPTFRAMVAADMPTTAVNARVNDTNVTASISAQTITLGWTGTLAVSRGGIGVGTLASNGVLYGNGTSAIQALAVNAATRRQYVSQASSAAPSLVNGTWHNVRDYGAVGDGSTLDDTAIAAAFAAAVGALPATVYFPAGYYKVSQGFTMVVVGNLAVIGAGRVSTTIYQTSNTATPTFDFDLSGGIPKRNRVMVVEIGFKTSQHVNASTAIKIDCGNTAIASSENIGGSYLKGITIDNYDEADTTGGWTNGIILRNIWHCHLEDIYGYGNATTWVNSGATPGVGGHGPGSGCFLKLLACFNSSFSMLSCNFWSQGFRIDGAGNSGEIAAQGLFFNLINAVEVVEFFHWYKVNGTGIEAMNLMNFQCDSGNISDSNITTIYGEGGSDVNIIGGEIYQIDGVDVIRIKAMAAFTMAHVTIHASGSQSHGGLYLEAANANMFNACLYNGMAITFDSLSAYNQLNNYDTSTITDAGLANRKLQYLF